MTFHRNYNNGFILYLEYVGRANPKTGTANKYYRCSCSFPYEFRKPRKVNIELTID